MGKLESVAARKEKYSEILEKLEANARQQDELGQEEIDLIQQLADVGGDDEEVETPVQQRKKPGPQPGAKRGRPAGSSNGNGKGTRNGNPSALHNLIRDKIIAPSMPTGVPFKQVVTTVTRWITNGTYKSAAKNVTNVVSQAMNKLRSNGEVSKADDGTKNYVIG